MKQDEKRPAIGYYAMLVIGALAFVAPIVIEYGPVNGISTMVWLVAFLYIVRTSETKGQLAVAFVVFAVCENIKNHGLSGNVIVDVMLLTCLSVLFFAIMLIDRLFSKERDSLITTLVFPVLWEIGFILVSLISLPSTMRLDMYFFDIKPIIQSVSVLTSYGATFLVAWVASLIAFAIITRRFSGIFVAGTITVLILAFGIIRIAGADEPSSYVKVAYTTGPYVGDFKDFSDADYDYDIKCFDRAVRGAASSEASILVFNEESFELSSGEAETFIDNAKAKAEENNLHILVGIDLEPGGDMKSANRLVWIDNYGEITAEYDKKNLIPLIESEYEPGDGNIPNIEIDVNGETVKIAFAICYDSNFSAYLRQIDDETDIIFLPSWDWRAVTDAHQRICGTLAVEKNMAVIKPTYDGKSVVVDRYGNIVYLSDTSNTGFEKVQVVDIPIGRGEKDE